MRTTSTVIVDSDRNLSVFVIPCIRVKSPWVTFQEILSKLDKLEPTYNTYNSGSIECLIGFQRNSKNELNEVLINWKRLCNQASCLSENIEIYSGK